MKTKDKDAEELRLVSKSGPEYRDLINRRRDSASSADEPKSFFDYWRILRRRKYYFSIPLFVICMMGLYFAISLPATYRSEATLLIEDQEIPEDIVGATVRRYAAQQIELNRARLLTAQNIQRLVKKFNFYGLSEADNAAVPASVISKFRDDLVIELLPTEIIESRGRSGDSAIAFTLAFKSTDPALSRNVTEELVQLFLAENQRQSTSRTTSVSDLLKSSIEQTNKELILAEAELADFKARNEGALPELRQLNLSVISRTDEQLSDISRRIQELEQRKLQLSAQLAPLSRSAPVTLPSGEIIMSDRERLRALLTDYGRKRALYQPGHPDLVSLEREIASLRELVGDTDSQSLVREQLRQEQERLAMLRERYSDDHPDIQNSISGIAALQAQLSEVPRTIRNEAEIADNPAYVLINTQLQSANLEIQNLLTKRSELQARIAEHEEYIRRAPKVEMEYDALVRKHENIRAMYNDLQEKLRAAEVATEVEQEITGQRFTLIEPANLPLGPAGPNRIAIALLGFILGAGAGISLVILAEFLDSSIRSARELAKVVGSPPMAVIPYINNSVDVVSDRNRRILIVSAFLVVAAILISVAYLPK